MDFKVDTNVIALQCQCCGIQMSSASNAIAMLTILKGNYSFYNNTIAVVTSNAIATAIDILLICE